MELFLHVSNVTAPVLLCILAGLIWVKRGLPFDNGMVTPLLMYLAVPCLLLASFSGLDLPHGPVLRLLVATVLAHLVFWLAGWLFLRLFRLDARAYLSSLIFGNNGNLGLPLCLLAFGQEGLSMGLVFMIVNSVGLFTLGIWIASERLAPQALLRTPTLYAAAGSLALLFAGIKLPPILHKSFEIMGDLAIPLMLLALGASLAGLKVRNLRESLLVSLAKVALGVGTAVPLAWLLELQGVAKDVFLLQSIMPVAVFNYLLAEHYGGDAQTGQKVAGLVVVSSLMGLLVIPGALALLL